MVATDRRHSDDFPVQQLEPVVLTEDARLGHPMEFVHTERPPEQLRVHGVLSIPRVGVDPLGSRWALVRRTCRRGMQGKTEVAHSYIVISATDRRGQYYG